MKIRKRDMRLFYGLVASAAGMSLWASNASAQAQNVAIKPGEVMVYCQPGTPQADVQSLANLVGTVKIVPSLFPDVYEFFLPANKQDMASTTAAISALKGDNRLKWVGGNRIRTLFQTKVIPNDALYKNMHPLPQINMPQAWALQKGQKNVNLCDIDSGFDPKHEDLIGRYDLANSYDWGQGRSDITAGPEDHGVCTSGIMIANTNNKIGVSGICWQNTLCIGEKIADSTGALSSAAIINAYADVHNKYKTAHIVAVNMSYGGPGDPTDMTDPENVGLAQMSNDGIILCASAGNSSADDHATLPAASPYVLTVSAVNKSGVLTYYSSFGKVDIAAPGGEMYSDTDPNGYQVCKLGSGYAFEQGTSFSCPTVTAVATLIMSVPGITPAKAKQVLLSTANHTGLTTLPDIKYGYGIVDAYAALVQISSTTSIVSPDGIDPSTGASSIPGSSTAPTVSTQKPAMSFTAFNIPPANETFTIDPGPGQIQFTADQLLNNGTVPLANVSEVNVTGTTTGTNPQYTISFRYAFPVGSSGTHTIQITGVNPNNNQTITNARTFTLLPHTFGVDTSGVALVSFPYNESSADLATANSALRGALLPSSTSLYRWFNVPTVVNGTTKLMGTYGIYGSGHTSSDPGASDPAAALSPTLYVPTLDQTSGSTLAPLGVAYFMKTPAPLPYNTYGSTYPSTSFRIPLHDGWNMIGDPYNFAVGFNAMEIEQLSGTRLTVQNAVDQAVILPHIYHYANGDYTFQSLPDGTLNPWEGQWIYVLPRNGSTLADGVSCYLIVLPAAVPGTTKAVPGLQSGVQTAVTSKTVSGPGSWNLQIQASTGNLHDNYNYIGMSGRAASGMDALKVPKPPKVGNYVTVGISHTGLDNVSLAQDIQPLGSSRTWDMSVSSNQGRAAVTVSWPNVGSLPRGTRVILTDKVTGQTVDLRNESGYTYTPAAGEVSRGFTITATQSNPRSRAVVSNITINPGRAGSRAAGTTEIGYAISADSKVDVSILGLNGKVISQVSPSRAVASGQNSVVWTGTDAVGHAVPAGSYILQIRAVGAQGEVTRQVVPFTVSGR